MPEDSNQILNRARRYCAYQERCIQDVKAKLKQWKVKPAMAVKIIDQLLDENYLDEKRYAMTYASGRFRLKHWGKTKIMYELKGRGIAEGDIRAALEEIDEEEYRTTLLHLLEKKNTEIKEGDKFLRKKKLVSFALQKGYEYTAVKEVVEQIVRR